MRRNPDPSDLAALQALRQTFAAARANVLHGHGSKGAVYARLVRHGPLDRTAVRAYTPHGGSVNYHPGTFLNRLYMVAEKLMARRTDVFLFESEYVAKRFRESVGPLPSLCRIVHNGVSDAEFEPVERASEARDLVYVGELRPAKGIHTLFDALVAIRDARGTAPSLLVVGSGPSEAELHEHAASAGLAKCITFVPPQPIRAALGCGRVMVLPSHFESLPYVALEAAAAAQPLIATRVGGIPEIFGPHSDDLVPPDDASALARAIAAKLEEPEEERAAKAMRLREFVQAGFSLNRMVDGVMDGYAAALDQRRSSQVSGATAVVKTSVSHPG
jgi:glycosyltransferase involved in cell wall biosynthesis